jgi:hypothetical protein
MSKLSIEQQVDLWKDLEELRKTFPNTIEGLLLFAQVVVNTLIPGAPDLNPLQADICKYLYSGPLYRMIQAQRGQSKTTLTAIYSVFLLIHNPHYRIVVFSQSGDRAQEISTWIVKIFKRMDFLNFMLPDTSAGDRESVKAFDIHYVFKGGGMSPSVSCKSIEAGAAGMRADVIIADDIESLVNSRTIGAREILEEATKEFESINMYGDIIYLGTPQSIESIYNNLPARGYDIRIWPGRYPTVEDIDSYGTFLAPMIREAVIRNPTLQYSHGATGKSGAPTCPEMMPEDFLIMKEISQGVSKFRLQYLLNTELADSERFPLKLSHLICTELSGEQGPLMPVWAGGPKQVIQDLPKFGNKGTDKFHKPIDKPYDWKNFERTVMYIDPAGGGKNADETGYAIVKLIGVYVYIVAIGGVQGGYEEEKLMKLVNIAKKYSCKEVYVEENYGHGAHMAVLKPLFEKHWRVNIQDNHSVGQKEVRIIGNIEPLLSSHRLVIDPEVIRKDMRSIEYYPTDTKMTYSFLFQLSNITLEKDCLKHDDRVEALSGALSVISESIDYDMLKVVMLQKAKEHKEFLRIWSDPKIRREELYCTTKSPPKDRRMKKVHGRKNMFNGISNRTKSGLLNRW